MAGFDSSTAWMWTGDWGDWGQRQCLNRGLRGFRDWGDFIGGCLDGGVVVGSGGRTAALPLWIPACAGMTRWGGHTPRNSLRSFAPLSSGTKGAKLGSRGQS